MINNSEAVKDLEFNFDINPLVCRYYRTSETENCEDLGLLNTPEVILTPNSITTLVIEGYHENPQSSADPNLIFKERRIDIYPVPASSYLNVDLKGNFFVSYEIAGIEGRVLIKQNIPLYTDNLQITKAAEFALRCIFSQDEL